MKALAIAVLCLVSGVADAQQLQTQDGLEMALRADGRIDAVVTEGNRWGAGEGESGLVFSDVAAGGGFLPAGGRVQPGRGGLVHRGTHARLQIEFEATYRPLPGAVAVEGFVRDTAGRDRAITVRVALPVDAVGGTWWSDIRRSQPIADKTYANLHATPGVGASGKASAYPWGAISNRAGMLCLGVPMDHPVVHRIVYDGRLRSFCVEFDFGLSPLTAAFPGRADFKLVVFRGDPAWGFRSAAARYYGLFPEAFRRRAVGEGLWMPFTDVAKVEDPEDFNFVFQEGGPNIGYDQRHGVYSFPYISPHWAWLWMPDRKEKPTPEYIAQRLSTGLRSGDPKVRREAQLIANCAAKNAEGAYHYDIGQAHWAPHREGHLGWYVMFPANADPDLKPEQEGPTTGAEALATVERVVRQYNRPEAFVDGFYFDGVDERPLDNYAAEQFRSAEWPLTFGTATRRAILCGPFSSYKLLKRIADRMHETGRMTMANGIPSRFPFSVAWLDAGGSELEPSIEREPVGMDWLAYARTLMFHKPLLLLYKPRLEERFDRDLSPYLVDYMSACLLYAAEPSLFKIFSNTDPSFYYSFFERPDWYNRYRPIFLDYLPLVRRLGLAGWEPVTYARCGEPRLLVERFGSGANLHLVVYNPLRDTGPLVTELDVELGPLGWDAGARAYVVNLGEGRAVPVTRTEKGVRLRLAVPPRRAVVLAVRQSPAGLADFDIEEAGWSAAIARSRLRDQIEQPLPIDFESDPDGVPVGFHTYSYGDAQYRSDTKTFHSGPRSELLVLRGKARATLSATLPARGGAAYRVSAWARAEMPSGGSAHFYVRWHGKGKKELSKLATSTQLAAASDWRELTLAATAPEEAEEMLLVLVATNSGQREARVWFDEPTIVEQAPGGRPTKLLPLAPKWAPASAAHWASELDRLGARLKSLAAQTDAESLRAEILRAAGEVRGQAESLRKAEGEYRGVAAALEVVGRRLRRGAGILESSR